MNLKFFKYQGTGNDFVIIDDRSNSFPKDNISLINTLCDRRFGVGADGLILLGTEKGYDFKMTYFNADGIESTMCGNGGRCLAKFAYHLGIIEKYAKFIAVDGDHEAYILENGDVKLKMSDVKDIQYKVHYYFLDTGSPHYVERVTNLAEFNVFEKGKEVRYNKAVSENGTNVNFIHATGEAKLHIRTYERGVENETLSCGTGSVAAAISLLIQQKSDKKTVEVQTQGGNLTVHVGELNETCAHDVWLQGPAELVFEGITKF